MYQNTPPCDECLALPKKMRSGVQKLTGAALEYNDAKEYQFKYQMSDWSIVFQKKLLANPFAMRPTFNNLCLSFAQSHEFAQEILFAYYIHTDQVL